MPKVTVTLNISKEKILKFYQGSVHNIVAHADDGRVIRFPINTVRQFVKDDGIKGRFEIEFNQQGKFMGIVPIQS
tara:strand:- start:57658 stop:57882 length:225 start_codon:yes stop_codon:yes gene_type:complete